MIAREKKVSYRATNSYSTLNDLTQRTKNVWFVFHGIGFLSRYFLKYFRELPPDDNYIVAPQAPSKYYLNGAYNHVGASWLTKDNTEAGTENILNYMDGILLAENVPEHCKIFVFGFSQGVSIAMRWVALRKIACDHLVLYAGGIPPELTRNDFDFIPQEGKVTIIVGDSDEYLTRERLVKERHKISLLFGEKATYIMFPGGHEVKMELINSLI
ncbi:MAG TPA: hypothetical protein VKN36_08220 [Eudoraea sp.]|nr:hypothetical protein [Eudoraea sp.]